MTPYVSVALPAVCVVVMLGTVTAETGDANPASEKVRILSGEPRLIVVTGYSTSFHWWAFLQRKVDRYMPGDRVVEVRPATRGGTPIAGWMDARTGEPRPPWTQILRPALQAEEGRLTVVLCQQSLQGVFGERREGIRSTQDNERIAYGADVLEKYARLLLRDGADVAFVAMHIYKKPMEPEIGNERLALAEVMTRGIPNLRAGPDVWEPTRQHYPKAFAEDRLHPNSIGAEIMAQLWFETLLKHDSLQVPEWSREEMAEAVKGEPVELRGGGFQQLLREWGVRPGGALPTRGRPGSG